MPTAASTNAVIYLGEAAASPIAETFDISANVTSDTAEDTAHGDTWRTRIPTLNDFTLSLSKHWVDDAGGGREVQWVINRTILRYYLYPVRTTTTIYWYGTCRLGGGGLSLGLEDVIDQEFEAYPVSQPLYVHP